MITDKSKNVNTENAAVECQFGDSIRELKFSSTLRSSNIRKKKGGQDTAFSKNTYYRFLNESQYNWKRFLTLLAVRVTDYFNSLTKPNRIISLVLDDSVIPRERSKQVELLSRVYDHVTGKTVKGFNMLTLGWTDNYSFVPVAFNMIASADADKRLVPASESINKRKAGYKSREAAALHKPQAAVKMIHDALAAGIRAGYVLMDTWFTNEPFI